MVNMPLDAPITRREYHLELMIVWVFVVLATSATLATGFRWISTILPLGALGMVGLHAIALRRGTSGRPRTTPSADKGAV